MYGKGKVTEDPKQAEEWSTPFYGKALMPERAQAVRTGNVPWIALPMTSAARTGSARAEGGNDSPAQSAIEAAETHDLGMNFGRF